MKILKHFTHVFRKDQPNRNILSSLLQLLTKHEKNPVKKWSGDGGDRTSSIAKTFLEVQETPRLLSDGVPTHLAAALSGLVWSLWSQLAILA